MSGGHFDYRQYEISNIAEKVKQLIQGNDSDEENEWGGTIGRHYAPETIEEFKKALKALQIAVVFVQRIDWLVCGDDREESFHRRLKEELDTLGGMHEKR